MKAPSEKHLEDWIVAHTEKFLPGYKELMSNEFQLLDRQIKVPSGVIDLIGYDDQRLYIIELKKNAISAENITQLLRYIGDIRYIWDSVNADSWVLESQYNTVHLLTVSQITGVIVGRGLKDKSLNASIFGAELSYIFYDYDQDWNEYTFECLHDNLCDFPNYSGQYNPELAQDLETLSRSRFTRYAMKINPNLLIEEAIS